MCLHYFDVLLNYHHLTKLNCQICMPTAGRIMFVFKQDLSPSNAKYFYLTLLFIWKPSWEIKGTRFQVDASMTTISLSFHVHVQRCRLVNSAKIIQESEALNALIRSSITRGNGSVSFQSKKWQFKHPSVPNGIKAQDIIRKYLWILVKLGIIS